MIERYSTLLMSDLWKEETKFEHWLLVEQTVALAQGELGTIPKTLYPKFIVWLITIVLILKP
jgi:adenylosuccinate lyase